MLGKMIKKTRKQSGKTQKDLADLLGRTSASISDLERGKVNVKAVDLYLMSLYFEIPIKMFFQEFEGFEKVKNMQKRFEVQKIYDEKIKQLELECEQEKTRLR